MPPPQAISAIAAARRDLAFRAGVSENDVVVCEIKAMEWPDTGLGCPQPYGVYQEAPTRGYRIVLDAVSREYEYHADEAGRLVYCGKRRQG